ncbi:MAG: Rieske (2Fe-2S) protein [Emcibacter sp.]|nr:Rieske (2Fe-2S) protein [Emcibacter sp.]
MEENWVKVSNIAKLVENGRMIFRHKGKQILLIKKDEQIFAVNNRCPHEGYPLSEGTLSEDCNLTCNWHNWKFDLTSGETIVGGDDLRHYPLRMQDDCLWIDVQNPPDKLMQQRALDNIQDSFPRYEYDRMAREISRFRQAGGRYEDVVIDCIKKNYDHLQYGLGHAFGAATDWLSLAEEMDSAGRKDEALAAVLEVISHVAWDVMRDKLTPFSENILPYKDTVLLAAIEAEDEIRAIALVRGAFAEGLGYDDLEPVLAAAALAHYNDFGHSAIYVYKIGQLIERLGHDVLEPLVLSLIRQMIYARREDLIPEFSHYKAALATWDGKNNQAITAQDLKGLTVNRTLDRMVQSSARPEDCFRAVHETLGWNMLHFDLARDLSTDHPVAHNVSWLNFTHGLTFANALRNLCGRYPILWPQALLQLACFSGRNVNYCKFEQNMSFWHVNDPQDFFAKECVNLVDTGYPEPIISCHRVKLLAAIREDVPLMRAGSGSDIILASVNRYLNSPIKRKHSLRTAKQARQFVAREG